MKQVILEILFTLREWGNKFMDAWGQFLLKLLENERLFIVCLIFGFYSFAIWASHDLWVIRCAFVLGTFTTGCAGWKLWRKHKNEKGQ